jgi:hypothetical protein
MQRTGQGHDSLDWVARDIMENDLSLRVGLEGSPLRRIKTGRDAKLAVARLLVSPQYRPQIRLRGYLAIGRVPPSELVTEENIARALGPEDSLSNLALLARRIPFVDVEIPLVAVSKGLLKGSSGNPRRLARKLERFATKLTSAKASLRLTEKSLYEFIRLVDLLAKMDSSTQRDRKPSRSPKKPQNPFGSLVKLVAFLAMASERPSRLLGVELIASLHRGRAIDIEEQLASDADFGLALGEIWAKTMRDVEEMALEGRSSDFGRWVSVLRALPFDRGQTKLKLEDWYEDRARFPASIQASLKNLLGISASGSEAPEIIVDQSEALETTQLASILLRMWDAREEGPNAKDAFEQLQGVLEGFFGIRLRGTVGEVENFNPRVHEVGYGDRQAAKVKLVRPWVEFSQHGTTNVIVKAIVKSQD